jgi:superoxide reductase
MTTQTATLQVFQCGLCGQVVEVLNATGSKLVCCGQPMNVLAENTVEASREKHIPVVTVEDKKLTVTVGSVAHPMEEKHYIAWIELISDGKVVRKALAPGDAPTATFCTPAGAYTVRALCNLHGLWKAE